MFTAGVDYVYIPNSRARGNQVTIRNFLADSDNEIFNLIQRNSPECFEVLMRAMCVHYFLPCGSNGSIHVPQFLCPDVCSYLVNDVCKEHWTILIEGLNASTSLVNSNIDVLSCRNTSQAISYLNLSNDCCSNAGIVVPSSTPQTNSTSNIIAIISSTVSSIVVLLIGITCCCCLLLFHLLKRKRMRYVIILV